LAAPTPKTKATQKLIKSGVDCAIVIDLEKEECLKRALGRRVDPNSNELFHLEENLPPIENAAKVERLIPFDDAFNSELGIMDKHC